MDKVGAAADCYYKIVFYSSIIGILALTATLIHVIKGTKHQFLIFISVLLLVSNLCAILSNSFARVWIYAPDDSKQNPYIYLQATASAIRDITFNVAHWVFAFQYWVISIEMQQAIQRQEFNQKYIILFKLFNYGCIFLCCAMPCVYSVTFVILNMQYPNMNVENPIPAPPQLVLWYLISSYSKGVLLTLSSFILADSIRRIRQSISQVDLA